MIYVLLGALGFATVLWWLSQKEKKDLWFPLSEFLATRQTWFRKIIWKKPPWFLFLLFCLSALLLVLFYSEYVFFKRKKLLEFSDLYLVVDRSPSMEASFGSAADLEAAVIAVAEQHRNKKIWIKVLPDSEFVGVSGDLRAYFETRPLQYSRTGWKGTLPALLPNDDSALTLIFSDLAKRSWSVQPRDNVVVYSGSADDLNNQRQFFFSSVSVQKCKEQFCYVSVYIERMHRGKESVALKVRGPDDAFEVEAAVEFESGLRTANRTVRIPHRSDLVTLHIEADDAMPSDNQWTLRLPKKKFVYLHAQDYYEKWLDDPVYYLEQAFKTKGLATRRGLFDPEDHEVEDGQFTVIVHFDQERDCQAFRSKPFLAILSGQGPHLAAFCSCFRCPEEKVGNSLHVRDWIKAVQAGNQLSTHQYVSLFPLEELVHPSNLRLLASLGKNWTAFFPATSAAGELRTWPQIEHSDDREDPYFFTSNIPFHESFLGDIHNFDAPTDVMVEADSTFVLLDNPLRMVRVLFAGLLVLMLMEGLYLFGRRFWSRFGRRGLQGLILLGVFQGESQAMPIHLALDALALEDQKLQASVYPENRSFDEVSRFVTRLTSMDLKGEAVWIRDEKDLADHVLLWTRRPELLTNSTILDWIRGGGTLILEQSTNRPKNFGDIPLNHPLLRSYFLLNTLPQCQGVAPAEQVQEGRPGVIMLPFCLTCALADQPSGEACQIEKRRLEKLMVNLLAVVYTLDYKIEQLQIPDVLKRFSK